MRDYHEANADELSAALEGHDIEYNHAPKLDENMITSKKNLADTEKVIGKQFELKNFEKF